MTEEQQRSRWARYRDRQRGGPPQPKAPEHGTIAAARRHQREGGTAALNACASCKAEWKRHQAEQYAKRKARKPTT